jgi:hypothetical protein
VRDALLAVSVHATTPTATHSWCSALQNLVRKAANAELFSTAEVRDALVALRPQVTTADVSAVWCNTILLFVTDKDGHVHVNARSKLFRVPAVLKSHASLKQLASTTKSATVAWITLDHILKGATW